MNDKKSDELRSTAKKDDEMEKQWIEHLRRQPGSEYLGDDAAVFGDQLLTVDMLTEGVDFLLEKVPPEWIGRKSLAVNLSDIAAMGGVPEAALVAVALPKNENSESEIALAEKLYAGMQPLIEKFGLKLIGGDTNSWDGGLVISITLIGRVSPYGVFRRSGGRPGDVILCTGPLGGSILGKQFHFEPRIFEALYLNEHHEIHAAMDISDGFSLDLHRLATESRLGAVIFEDQVPISADAEILARQTRRSAFEHAISDGEDFELLLAVPPNEAERLLKEQPLEKSFGVTLYAVAELTDKPGLRLRNADGTVRPLEPQGYEHR